MTLAAPEMTTGAFCPGAFEQVPELEGRRMNGVMAAPPEKAPPLEGDHSWGVA